MMLLDLESKKGRTEKVSLFFRQTFMGAEFSLDARTRTDLLYRCLVSAGNELRTTHRIDDGQEEVLHAAIDHAVASTSVSVDAFIDSLPLPAPERERINEIVSASLPDREFEIDTTFMQRLTKRRRFRGD